MSSNVERASGTERYWSPSFPESWGPAPGRPDSEERAAWVRRHVHQWVETRMARPLSGRVALAIAEMNRRPRPVDDD